MAMVTLVCPHCGISKELDEAILPPAKSNVICQKCQGRFPLEYGDLLHSTNSSQPLPEYSCAAPVSGTTGCRSSQAGADAESNRILTFDFTGNGKEYFGIWIVNTLLTIVTLGIYSPWAKVRKRRYFYGNTLLDSVPFDYHADPLAILKGWVIAGIFFGAYSFFSRTSPVTAFAMMLVFAGVFPWVIVRSRIFNMRNSSHRNIRFTFKQNYRDAYNAFLWRSLLIPLTLGLMTPYVVFHQKKFIVENSTFGKTPFRFNATSKQYYRIFLPIFILVPLAIAVFAWFAFSARNGGSVNTVMAIIPTIIFLIIYLFVLLYLPVKLANVTWSTTSIGGHTFNCALRVRDMTWLYFSNAVAVICTLGLLAPWATVRMIRYRLSKLTLSGVGQLDTILAADDEVMGATGEELGDMLGFDFGL